uniref:Kunitz-type protease inhibitor 1 n=1 Tax=Oryzias latipes TaxID=8090 RepID=A0A3P9KBQ0_ORYLA
MSRCGSLPLLLLLMILLPGGGAEECSDSFRRGKDNFVLDTAEAVKNGAAPLASERAASIQDCVELCCGDERCNLAMLVPADPTDEDPSPVCALFNCVYRSKFVCDFTTQEGYQSSIRNSVYDKYLQGPGEPTRKWKKTNWYTGEVHSSIANAGRDIIAQPGRPVLLSGIESLLLNEAHITKYQWILEEGDSDVVIEETNQTDTVKLTNLKEGSYLFLLTITDTHGETSKANVSVIVITPEMSISYCMAPLKVGPCRAAFPRWQYDATQGLCTEFHFGGCNANENNYLSENDCMSACQGVKGKPLKISPKKTSVTNDKDCSIYFFSRFKTENFFCCDTYSQKLRGPYKKICSSSVNQTFSRLLSINLSERKIQCTDAPRTGPCRASIPRWFYDPLKLKCYSFIFGGCNGNENNFEDETTCMETCKDVSGTNYTHVIQAICGASASLTSKERKESNVLSVQLSQILFSNVTQTRKYFMLQLL